MASLRSHPSAGAAARTAAQRSVRIIAFGVVAVLAWTWPSGRRRAQPAGFPAAGPS
jgi:hypothetical protein